MNLSDCGIWCATPNYNGWVAANYTIAMLQTQVWAASRRLKAFHPEIVPGDSLVPRVRCVMLETFLKSDPKFTHFLFIDSDLGWEPQSIERLLLADQDVVVGCYPKKKDDCEWPMNFGEKLRVEFERDAPLLPLKDAPTGFMMVKRSVFEKMMAAYPERRVEFGPGSQSWLFFDAFVDYGVTPPRYLSEDYGFCRLWAALGGKVWIEPNVGLSHMGTKTWYFGSPSDFWRHQSLERRTTHAHSIQGWMTTEEIGWLNDVGSKFESIIQVGAWKGRSAAALLEGNTCRVTSIDTWQGSEGFTGDCQAQSEAKISDVAKIFRVNMERYGDRSVQVISDSIEAAKSCEPADIVFLDGNHTYEYLKAEIEAWLPKARCGMCGHDYGDSDFPGVKQAVDEAFGDRVKIAHGNIWMVELDPARLETEPCNLVASEA